MVQEHSWGERLLHLFLPNQCMFCGKPLASGLRRCESCEAQAVRPDPRICPVCEQLRADCRCRRPFQGLAAPFYYEMGADKAIQDLKFHCNLLNARKLGDDLAELLVHPGLPDEFCYGAALVPVPLHPRDRRRRGYNQAEEIAWQISRRTGIPLRPEALKKCRRTAKQHELSAAQRKTNLQGAYQASLRGLEGQVLLLVDDVFTTGSTMDVCASALLQAGASQVYCLTAAKTRRRGPASPGSHQAGARL